MEEKKMNWSKSIRKGNSSKTVEVDQVENGYVISIRTEGKDEDGNYKYECKRFISEKNPLENETPVKSGKDIKSVLSGFFNDSDDISV